MNQKFIALIRSSGCLRPDPNPEMWYERYVLAFALLLLIAVLVLIFGR